MTVVVGTAGHIDHGKTTLLRALTGIDADRLPEERRRGMTIDVGYAHVDLGDGTIVDFVDVPGHDRLVGNMLVGAGEIDAVVLVVAADDGPRAQTLEHLALLDALGVSPGIAVVTKADAVAPERVTEVMTAVDRLLESTSLGGSPMFAVSGITGVGLDAFRDALRGLVTSVAAREEAGALRPPTLAVDRAFSVKGRGVVVTGTLRGGPLGRGDRLRLLPADREVRVREVQVHGDAVDAVARGGRTALNLVGVDLDDLHRGDVLTADPDVRRTDRLLAAFPDPRLPAPPDRSRWRLHAGTAAVDASIGRGGRDALPAAAIVRLAAPIAARPGDRFLLRRSGSGPIGGVVLDVAPPRGISRRRQTADRVAALARGVAHARLDLHGALVADGSVGLAPDVAAVAGAAAIDAVGEDGVTLAALRTATGRELRRHVTLSRDDALTVAGAVVATLVADGRLTRDGDVLRRPGSASRPIDPAMAAAMDRLEASLAVVAPPSLGEAARSAGCAPDGIRELERAGRIAVLEPDLAYAMSTYRDLTAEALRLAAREPLTPAAFRDATGTSRKYVLAILEDLDRRAILRRTPAGHVPGPRAPRAAPPVGAPRA